MIIKGDYGIAQTINFPLYAADGSALTTGASFAAGDVVLIKDEGTPANSTNLPTHEGNGIYSLVLTATEKQAARLSIAIDDQTATELWLSIGITIDTSVTVEGYGGGVWFDGDSGATGTTVGVNGTPLRPVNTFADAITLAGTTKLYRIYHLGGLSSTTITAGLVGIEVVRIGDTGTRELLLSGTPSVAEARFENVQVTGVCSGSFTADLCIITGLEFGSLNARSCELKGLLTPTSSLSRFADCFTHFESTTLQIDLSNNGSDCVFRRFSGNIEFINMDGTNGVDIEGTGMIVVASSCTGGTISVRGDFEITDNSAGAVTINTTASGVNLTQINGSTTNVDDLLGALEPLERLTVTTQVNDVSFAANGCVATVDGSYLERVGVWDKDTTTTALRGWPFTVIGFTGASKTFNVTQLPGTPVVGDTFTLRP